jgi:hypothetical protein
MARGKNPGGSLWTAVEKLRESASFVATAVNSACACTLATAGREVPGPAKCRTHLPCTTCLTGQKKVGRISGTRAIGLVAPEGGGHGFGGFGPPLPACLLVELGCVWPVTHPCKLRRQRCSLAMMQQLGRHYTRTHIHSVVPRHGVISCLRNRVVPSFPLFLHYSQVP